MASTWITRRATSDGATRYRVEFRIGGRETKTRYAGSFRTMREAKGRRDYVAGELAALRVPDLHLATAVSETLKRAAERWKASRVDVAAGTLTTYTVALGRLLPRLGETPVEVIDAQMVADLIGELHAAGLKKATIRKTIGVLGMVLDHAGRSTDNPVRDRMIVKMPREVRHQVQPPTADHVEAVVRLLPSQYRLATLVLDATGMRVGRLRGTHLGRPGRAAGALADRNLEDRPATLGDPAAVPARSCARLSARRPPRRPARVRARHRQPLTDRVTRACTAAGVPAFSHTTYGTGEFLCCTSGMPWARIGEPSGMTTSRQRAASTHTLLRTSAKSTTRRS